MNTLLMIGVDLVAILILTLGIYFPRHRRRDLVVAFLGVNAGVVGVTGILGSVEIGIGLGMGLFGVLSIIRLRSSEISQREVAYYFSSLSIGLIAGLGSGWIALGLIALILVVMFVGDHPAVFGRYRQQLVNVDKAITDEIWLKARLEQILNAQVRSFSVQKIDLVNDTTLVDVCYQVRSNQNPLDLEKGVSNLFPEEASLQGAFR